MSTVDLRPLPRPFSFASGRKLTRSMTVEVTAIDSGFAWWTMLACSCVALCASAYLAWASLTSSAVAGCGGSIFDCEHVLHSRWSTVLSMPVSLPAIATHVMLVGLLLARPVSLRMQKIRWTMIGYASLAAGAAAVWFIGIQVFVIQHLCPYCLVAHTCALILATVFLLNRPVAPRTLKWIGAGATASLAGLIALQTLNVAPPTYEVIEHTAADGASTGLLEEKTILFEAPTIAIETQAALFNDRLHRTLTGARSIIVALANPGTLLYGQVNAAGKQDAPHSALILNNIKLDTSQWPLLGKPDAELVFVEMFDYTCPHCQRTHTALEGARQKFGDRLAIITLPVPLDGKCNPTVTSTHASHSEACEIAKLAIAVWRIDQSKFSEFHQYLFEAKPSYSRALEKATSMVDEEALKETLTSPLPSEYISKHVSLYQRAGAGTIPKLMFPKTTTVGSVESADTMIRMIEQHLR